MSDHLGEPTGHERYRGDLAAYALGALEEREAAELRRHLADCEACRAQLRWLQPAVDLLPRSVEQLEPPARPRQATDGDRAGGGARGEPGWDRGRGAETPARLGSPAVAPGHRGRRRGAVVVGAAGGYLLHQPGESSSVITARPLPAAPSNLAGTLEREDGSAILTMSRLPALPPNDVYEVWVQRDGTLEPSSLFVPRRDRTAEAAVPGPLDDADAVLVTREPRGGSRQPTSPPLLRADLH